MSKRRVFTREFKVEAASLVSRQGLSFAEAARRLEVCALQDHALSWAGRGGPAFSSAGGSSGVAVAAFFAAVFADGFWVCGGPSVGTQCGVVR